MSRSVFGAAALVLLVSACGGGSSGSSPGDASRDLTKNEVQDLLVDRAERNGGRLDGVEVTLPDGTEVVVDAKVPTDNNDFVSGYLLAGETDDDGNIEDIAEATVFGDPYDPATRPTGRFSYSGENRALLQEGGDYRQFEGRSELSIDFGTRRGTIEGVARAGSRRAEIEGDLAFNPSTGRFGTNDANTAVLTYTDGSGDRSTHRAGVAGSLHGDNEGFSALYEVPRSNGVAGVGVMSGRRDD